MSTGRLSLTMAPMRIPKRAALEEAPSARADRLAVWILLALGLLLMLVSVGKAEQPTATRVDRFQGPTPSGQTLHVENISGDIVASPGKEFSAVVTVTVSAPTQRKAEDILKKTEIVGDHHDDGWNLETVWPGMRSGRRGNRHGYPCEHCKIVARYEIVVPPGVTAELQTVNGEVRVRDVDGELNLETVNGSIDARGVRRSLEAQTVNGKIETAVEALPSGASVRLQSVNGNVALTLPKDAKFDLAASTMNGTIASTFPLPARPGEGAELPARPEGKTPRPSKPEKERHSGRVVIKDEDGETTVVDLRELEQELSESMRDIQISIEEGMREAEKGLREAEKELRRVRIGMPGREYTGSIGKGGAQIHLETLNGSVLLLAAGTQGADAKSLVSEHRSFVVTIPRVEVHVSPHQAPVAGVPPVPPVPPAPRVAPVAPALPLPPVFDGEIVRGDISGDFLSTSTGGDYRIGRVSGRVKILTHSGEIRVGAVGGGADLKSFGGDIVVGPVTGDLQASTMAGDIQVEAVSGSALADTAGGDIRIELVGGSLDARTSGGDIRAPRVGGGVRAVSAGGEIRIGVTSREVKGGITIRNDGGDVSLALPPDCKADVELIVTGADDESAIRSEFPELTISKRPGLLSATASLNGGGERVVVRTTSGTIRLKKGTGEK